MPINTQGTSDLEQAVLISPARKKTFRNIHSLVQTCLSRHLSDDHGTTPARRDKVTAFRKNAAERDSAIFEARTGAPRERRQSAVR